MAAGCALRSLLRSALTLLARCGEIESDLDTVEPRHADVEQGAGCCSMPGGRLDDIEMDTVARGTLQCPVFSTGATGDHAQDGQPRIALRASRTNRRGHLPGDGLGHGDGPHSTNYLASFSV
jgi:hypothetical protein